MHQPVVAALSAFIVVAACAGPSGGGPGAGSTTPPGAVGFEARTICEAECKRDDRCGAPPAGAPACYQRCATLPVRHPPVWDAGWVSQVATCIANMACGHDLEERCVAIGARASQTHTLCMQSGGRFCEVYDGLTPATDASVAACLRGGRGRDCLPPFDWK